MEQIGIVQTNTSNRPIEVCAMVMTTILPSGFNVVPPLSAYKLN